METMVKYAEDRWGKIVADTKTKMQKMIDKLSEGCEDYDMAINVQKTKVMVMNKMEKSNAV